jgi:flagellar hook protein FlgE
MSMVVVWDGLDARMTDAVSIATSALQAQQVIVGVIANNIANADTPGYRPQQVTLIPMSPGVAVGPIVASTQANVDIASELINLIVAKQAYAAAAKVVTASDQMTHDLLQAI